MVSEVSVSPFALFIKASISSPALVGVSEELSFWSETGTNLPLEDLVIGISTPFIVTTC
jgi:hypothetical protein